MIAIPIEKVNCLHCSRCDGARCKDFGDLIASTGKKTTPDKVYCLHIWEFYLPDGVAVVASARGGANGL